MADTQTTAQEVQFTALRYVAKKLFIAQSIQFQCTKLVKIQKQSGKNSNYFQNSTKIVSNPNDLIYFNILTTNRFGGEHLLTAFLITF